MNGCKLQIDNMKVPKQDINCVPRETPLLVITVLFGHNSSQTLIPEKLNCSCGELMV